MNNLEEIILFITLFIIIMLMLYDIYVMHKRIKTLDIKLAVFELLLFGTEEDVNEFKQSVKKGEK